MIKYIGLFSLVYTAGLFAQSAFTLSSENSVNSVRPSGNSIGVIKIVNDTVLMEAGGRLNISTDGGTSWQIFSNGDGIYKGGVSAIDYSKSVIFVSTIFDTSSSPKPNVGAGGGISFSTDFGTTWKNIPQPIDTFQTKFGFIIRSNGDTISTTSIRTNIDNVIFDLAVTDSSLWIASFAGGIRMSRRIAPTTFSAFEPVAIPPDTLDEVRADQFYNFNIGPFNANGQQVYNHTAFSVLAASDGIWAGTAGGINYSTDGGLSWKKFTAQNSGISGNFVVALAEQIFEESGTTFRNIWAATNRAVDPAESSGLSVTADSGKTWRVVLKGTFVNNIAFDRKTVYAATDDGMFRSRNLGLTWEKFITLIDKNNGDRNYSPVFQTVGVDTINHVLYFGNQDGLAISDDDGLTWRFARAYVDAGRNGEPKSYAYPNPFSPSILPNVTRFEFDRIGLNATDKVTIKIFDFAMDLVAIVAKNEPLNNSFSWNGLNNKGQRAANGTYVYTIEAGKRKFWGKVTVRN